MVHQELAKQGIGDNVQNSMRGDSDGFMKVKSKSKKKFGEEGGLQSDGITRLGQGLVVQIIPHELFILECERIIQLSYKIIS